MADYAPLHLLIDGRRLTANGRDAIDVLDPASGGVIGSLPSASVADLDEALGAAEKAFRIWRAVSPAERGALISRAAALLRGRTDAVARTISREEGKPISEAVAEVGFTLDVLEWHADLAKEIKDRPLPPRIPGARSIVMREPIGPVAAFTPWNLPIFLAGRKIATVIAAGCSIVIKPAEETPASLLMLAECFLEAGLPNGVLNVVYGDPSLISTHLITSDVIRKVSFTGSTTVGRQLGALAGEHCKPITMELGGHAPVLIFADADIDAVIEAIVPSKFANAGQICIAPTRFYVHDSLHDRFVEQFAERSRFLKVGAGDIDGVQMGPLANSRRIDAVSAHVQDALARGATLATGGERIGNEGFFFQPTVLADVPDDAIAMNQEPFGPVALTARFSSIDEAIDKANRLPYGLAAFAFTGSATIAQTVADQVEAGMIGVNTTWVAMPEAPFGGVKASGFGREGGIEGIEAYLSPKFLHQLPAA